LCLDWRIKTKRRIRMKAVYIRTSREEQNPENQLKDIETISGEDYILFKDKQSAWKEEKERENFERLKKEIAKRKIQEVYVWDLDRIYRNRKKLKQFFEFCKLYGCKIYSYRQQWLDELHKIPEPFNDIMHSLMLNIMGWLAEEESRKKSERVKLAVRKKNGVTKSYKGNKWGRKSLKVGKQIVELYNKGKTMREICNEVYYWDKNNHKKYVSLGFVHKTIAKYKEEKKSQEGVSQNSQ